MGAFFRFHPPTRPIPFNPVPVLANGAPVVECPTLQRAVQRYPISEPSTADHSRDPNRDFREISALSLQGEDGSCEGLSLFHLDQLASSRATTARTMAVIRVVLQRSFRRTRQPFKAAMARSPRLRILAWSRL